MHLIRNFFSRETQRISRQNKGKNKKTKRSSFCIQNNLFRWCCCLVVVLLFFLSFSLMDHQALQDWLHDMSTLPLDVELLRHAQQLQNLFTKILPADIVAVKAKYTKSFFLHSSGANVTCAWQMREWNQTLRCYCLCWTVVAYILKISDVGQNVSALAFHTLDSCIIPAWRMPGEQTFMCTPQSCVRES